MIDYTKKQFKKIPFIGVWSQHFYWRMIEYRKQRKKSFPGSKNFWENKYETGGNSGEGSYGKFAKFKAEILNQFVFENSLKKIIEFGCGDGNQLRYAIYPNYIGFDISEAAITLCKEKFFSDPTKKFQLMKDYVEEIGDLSLSLDVIFHLVEDDVYEEYMKKLFNASSKYVCIYSSNSNMNVWNKGTQTRHREFTKWIQKNRPEWKLIKHIPNKYPHKGDYRTGSFSDFYFFEKKIVN